MTGLTPAFILLISDAVHHHACASLLDLNGVAKNCFHGQKGHQLIQSSEQSMSTILAQLFGFLRTRILFAVNNSCGS